MKVMDRLQALLGWGCLALGVSAFSSASVVWVVALDGSKQCEGKSGRSLKEDQERFEKHGIPVLDTQKGRDGQIRAQMCGLDTGSLNAILIPGGHLQSARALGFDERSQ